MNVSSPSVIQKTCYVIMPFSSTRTLSAEGWNEVFEKLFKPTFELLGYRCLRSVVRTGSILQDIITNLHNASAIFADLTDNKPNVFYELGIAHTITTRVIMASQHVDECPSDLRPYGIIQYKPKPMHEQTIRFQAEVRDALSKLDHEEIQTSPVFQFLGRTMRHLEHLLKTPIAVMECTKCGRLYEVRVNETTQSDWAVAGVDNFGRRIHPIGIEHIERKLCGHWECARFKGLKGIQSF